MENRSTASRKNPSRTSVFVVLGALALGLVLGPWLWRATTGGLGAENIGWSRSLSTALHVLGPVLMGSFVGISLIQHPKYPFLPLVLTLTFLPKQIWNLQVHPAVLAALPPLFLGIWVASVRDRPHVAVGLVGVLVILSMFLNFMNAPYLQ